MRTNIVLCATFLTLSIAKAQETPPLTMQLPPAVPIESPRSFTLEKPLTASGLQASLVGARLGNHSPVEVIQAIVARGKTAVPLLREILFDTTSATSDSHQATPGDTSTENRIDLSCDVAVYTINALQAIGSQACFDILIECALSHPSTEARGAALVSLGHTYYDLVAAGALAPDLKIVATLLQCVDERQIAQFYQKSIGSLAREALNTWTGIDLGDPALDPPKIAFGKERIEMTWRAYRDLWWNSVSSKLAWSAQVSRFANAKP